MTDDDMRTIEAFVASNAGPAKELLRDAAVIVFRRYLGRGGIPKKDWNLHMKFMSEIDSPCPDYTLRGLYRKQLLEKLNA